MMIMLPVSMHAQKNWEQQQKDEKNILEDLNFAVEKARKSGGLITLEETLTRSLDYEYNKAFGLERSQVRLQLNDSAGYCNDLYRASLTGDTRVGDQYDAECVSRDSISFDEIGWSASRYPGATFVSRISTKKDGRTHYWLYDSADSLLVCFSALEGDTIFSITDTMPVFPGGEPELFKFMGRSIKYPQSALDHGISGIVYVRFTVGKTGELRNIELVRGVQHSLDAESVRLITAMPNWTPAFYQGKPVDHWYNLPIRFTLR